jgi:formylglycine-generating enzyme
MKINQALSNTGVVLMFLLTACGGTPSPAIDTLTATLVPILTETAAPTLVPVKLSGPAAGTVMTWMDGSSLVYVPAGQFNMGASGLDNPSHTVSLSAYWISRTKITNRMYSLCVGVGVCAPPATVASGIVYSNPTYADHPVVGVTWEQANTYCGWDGGRLPTEAEWEKAARGPGGQTYPWGNEAPSCDLLNYAGCSVNSTTSVIAYPESASPYLALDMAGNTFEWTGDWYDANYYPTSPIQDPIGAESGIYRVVRGSGFESDSSQIASAIRRPADPNTPRRDIGFRCVVQQPINFPPYCQASPYLPNAEISTPASACVVPVAQRLEQSCKGKVASNTILLPLGSTYVVRTEGYQCTSAAVAGMLQVTCYGPDLTSGTLEVCNSTCTDQTAPVYTGSPVCDPGYSYDPATRLCAYSPLNGQSGVQGCPAGYAPDSTGQICRPTIGLDNQCPFGQYFDSLYGGCVPGNGQANCNLYGLNDASLASTCYLGCPGGYAFNSTSQCCQAPAIGLYPDCQPGLAFDPTISACAPRLEQASGTLGCTYVFVDMLQCAPPFACKQFTSEGPCIRHKADGCVWIEKDNACVYVKPK